MLIKTRTDVQEIIQDNDYLNNQNANYRAYCQDIADFYLPRKAWITTIRTKGERVKFNFLYDSTGIRAARTCASGFYSNLSNPAMRWFGFESYDLELMKYLDVRMYFKQVEDIMLRTLLTTNYYNVIQEFYGDYVVFGTSTFSQLDDAEDLVIFNQIPVKQVNRVVDLYGRLIELYNNFTLTAVQAKKLWGENAGPSVMKALADKKPFSEFEFLHYVCKRHEREEGKMDSVNMPWKSVWVNIKDKHLIGEAGFAEMPYMSEVFYRDSNDPNGFAPTMDVFAETKLVNAMQRTFIRADMKQADPALVLPSTGFVLPLNLNPAGLNYRDRTTTKDDLTQLPGGGNLSVTMEHIRAVQDAIKDGLFVQLFQSLTDVTKQMTIPEVQRRISENMGLLAPVVGRCNYGVHNPSLTRLYNQLQRSGELPQPPQILQNQQFRVVYLSPLVKAMRQSEVIEVQSFLADAQAVGAVIPTALDNIDEDKTIKVLHKMRNLTPEILRNEDEVIRMRKHRAEQDQMVAALQAGGAAAEIEKTLADSKAATQPKS